MRRSVEQLVDDGGRSVRAHAARRRVDSKPRPRARAWTTWFAARSVAVELRATREGARARVETSDGAEGVACSPRMVRVLQNLLVNAVRHTPADGTVRIEARRDERLPTVRVEDTGEGIAAADLSRVFEPFFRGDPARSGPGAGLGLALAKRIVEALGGRISAESRPQAGSRFHVELPV